MLETKNAQIHRRQYLLRHSKTRQKIIEGNTPIWQSPNNMFVALCVCLKVLCELPLEVCVPWRIT